MAIQFTCVSCQKAIEIDDKWAHRLVECPYCHDTVRSPGRSTLVESPPMAAPVSELESAAVAAPAPMQVRAVSVAPAADNKLAIVALVLAICACVLLGYTFVYINRVIVTEIGVDATPADVQQMMQDAMMEQQPWAYRVGLAMMGTFGLWLAGAVCSVVAITRRGRRGMAIAAVVVSAIPLLLFVLSAAAM